MGKYVIKDPQTTINGVDLSVYISECTVNMTSEDVDVTGSGDGGKDRLPGLNDDSLEFTFRQDFALAKVDATLFPLRGAAPFAVTVRASSAAKSTTNPSYEGNGIITDYTPLGGAIGDAGDAKLTLPIAKSLSRVTA